MGMEGERPREPQKHIYRHLSRNVPDGFLPHWPHAAPMGSPVSPSIVKPVFYRTLGIRFN